VIFAAHFRAGDCLPVKRAQESSGKYPHRHPRHQFPAM